MEHWSLRELVWAADAKAEYDWQNWSYSLAWLINAMPSFSKKRRGIHPNKINPLAKKRRVPRGVPMGPAAEKMLEAYIAKRDAKNVG